MQEWMENGCRLGWLIDPVEQKAYVYKIDAVVKTIETFNEKLTGDDVPPGFELNLSPLQ